MNSADFQAGPATATAPPRDLLAAFAQAHPGVSPDVIVRAPGRANLLGGHIDTHGGAVINIALDRGIWLAAARRPQTTSEIHAVDLQASVTLSHRRTNLDHQVNSSGEPLPRWALYPAGIAWALRKRGVEVRAMIAAFGGTLPMRAGLGSSAAVEAAFAIAWGALGGWQLEAGVLAGLGHQVEREYLTIGSGIQDQFTCLHTRRDHALWLDCRTLDYRHLPWPSAVKVVVCDTNTRRELAGSGFTMRSQDAHATARIVHTMERNVTSLRDITPEQLSEYAPALTEAQFKRARHVVTEISRVARGLAALERGDFIAFGALMNESYRSARDDYGSSSPALDAMWEAATSQPGCYGARYSGGGEAGVVVALVNAGAVEAFIAGASAHYQRQTKTQATLFVVEPSAGASVWG